MIECEVCGKTKATTKAKIEGSILDVCDECVAFGREIPTIEIKPKKEVKKNFEEMEREFVEDFKEIVKGERFNLGLTQKDLAREIGEKTSVIRRIESGWEPPLNVIRKLERVFSVKLMEELKEEKAKGKKTRKELTIGDVVEVS
jgi:putative transcription factor